jgi:hypothetical protein
LQRTPQHPAAAFGLARGFFMRDNKDFNLDSANHYAMKCAAGLKKQWKESEVKKYQSVGYREFTVNELQRNINTEAYLVADSLDTIEDWNHFLATYTISADLDIAMERRNMLAFREAIQKNDYASFEDFLKTYPNASQVKEAKALYEKLLYKSKTEDSTWQSYKSFIEKYPKSPFCEGCKEPL